MANDRLVVDCVRLRKAGAELINIMKSLDEKFYVKLVKKLKGQKTSSKMYWSVMQTFVNGKTPIIPPLLVNYSLTSNFMEKANIFNDFLFYNANL